MRMLLVFSVLAGCLVLPAAAAVSESEAVALTAKYNCKVCHTTNKKLVGPSYQDVAKKYSGDATSASKLAIKIKQGGSGAWGSIPMPPNNVPDPDLKKLVEWILSVQ